MLTSDKRKAIIKENKKLKQKIIMENTDNKLDILKLALDKGLILDFLLDSSDSQIYYYIFKNNNKYNVTVNLTDFNDGFDGIIFDEEVSNIDETLNRFIDKWDISDDEGYSIEFDDIKDYNEDDYK